ncbi:MAG: GGDEF-domain containing protein [Sphingomonas sp.]|nr:GGDEF-domain containing protein [Sphingomonas sp.]
MTQDNDNATPSAPGPGEYDLLNGSISIGAILLLVFTGSTLLLAMLDYYFEGSISAAIVAVIACIANIAVIVWMWRQHRARSATGAAHEARTGGPALRDALTGLLNRDSLIEQGAALIADAGRRHHLTLLLMFDLDHFKTVNDMHGHAVGDALLKLAAIEIAEIVPAGSLTARVGGDRFACAFAVDAAHIDLVERIAERLIASMARPFEIADAHCEISCSLGIARSDESGSDIAALIRSAEIATRAAKRGGGNQVAWFRSGMEQELTIRSELESGIRAAIPRGEIVPYFEPQVNLRDRKLTGFEVLARWEHPTRGLVAPDQFIKIAEESGLIGELSLSLMRQAFTAARDWSGDLTLSVNISPWQLRDAWFAQKIIRLLTETGFPAQRLEIEITESALFDNLALAQSTLNSLKHQGVGIVLDDFGTGFSSLAHLRALPFDRIKIDRSFVASMNDHPDSAALVNAIARMGDSLNLPVIAEGVENEVLENRLRAIGIARAQGWVYGKPLSIAGARRMLAERRMLAPEGHQIDTGPALVFSATIQRLVG